MLGTGYHVSFLYVFFGVDQASKLFCISAMRASMRYCVYTTALSQSSPPYRPYYQHVSFQIACLRQVRSTFGIHLTSITELPWKTPRSIAAGCLLTRCIVYTTSRCCIDTSHGSLQTRPMCCLEPDDLQYNLSLYGCGQIIELNDFCVLFAVPSTPMLCYDRGVPV